MSVTQTEFQALKTHGKALKAIFAIADEFDSVEQINQLTGEANARLASVKAEYEAEAAGFAKAFDAANADLLRVQKAVLSASADNDAARTSAREVMAEGNAKADIIIAAANEKAASIKAQAEATRAEIEAVTSEKIARLDALNADIAAKTEEAAAVESRIEAARAKIKRMMGE